MKDQFSFEAEEQVSFLFPHPAIGLRTLAGDRGCPDANQVIRAVPAPSLERLNHLVSM